MSAETGPATRPAAGGRWAWLVALWLTVALWPALGAPLDGSFDSSWRWAVAVAAARGLPAGLLPAGPLAAWLEPRAIESGTLVAASLFAVATRLLWWVALAGLFGTRRSPGRWAAMALLWLLGTAVAGRVPDEELVVLVLLLSFSWWRDAGEAPPELGRSAAAGALAGILLLVKASAGLEACAALAGAVGVRALRRRQGMTGPAVALGSSLLGGAAVGAWVAFDSPASCVRWASAVPELLSGYGATMALGLSDRGGLAAAGALLGVAAAAAWAFARRTPTAGLWLAMPIAFAAVAKHALVRPDVHLLGLVAWSVAVLGVAVVVAERRDESVLALTAGLVVLASAWPQARFLGTVERGAPLVRRAVGLEGVVNALETLRPEARRRLLDGLGRRRLAEWRQPGLAAETLSAGGVDAVPWRLTLLAANGLERGWSPSPSFQFYQASTAVLERRQAEHFAGATAPRWLIAHFDPLEGRNPLWEAPRTWRAIASRYRIAARPEGLLLLERRPTPGAWSERELGQAPLEWGAWMRLPEVAPGECLLARVELVPTPLGRLRRALFRSEPVYLDLAGGSRRSTGRALPELAAEGLVLDEAPTRLDELAAWLEGAGSPIWRRVRWRSGDAGRYRSATVRWFALRPSVSG
jgi:hypothetical protein